MPTQRERVAAALAGTPQGTINQGFGSFGMLEGGNMPLAGRPLVPMPGGGFGTVHSMSFGEDNRERLIPTIQQGRLMSPDEAMDYYQSSGQHLGAFATPQAAENYSRILSQAQGVDYGLNPPMTPTDILRAAMQRGQK